MSTNGIIFNIQRFSVNDGPGIRTTVFLKGCPLDCWWCHNPEGLKPGIENTNGTKIGTEFSVDEVFAIIEKDNVFYEESGGGVTFSGGEPLTQPKFLSEVLERCKSNGIHTTVDTSGYADIGLINAISKYTDLFLFDIKFINAVSHLKYTRVSNHEILNNLDHLIKSEKRVTIRIPLIPDITATRTNLEDIINHLKEYEQTLKINLLPFHQFAENKYNKYGIHYRMRNNGILEDSEILKYHAMFDAEGFDVSIGG